MLETTQEFMQWLNDRKATIEKKIESASGHIRMLLKTERAELDGVISAYKKIVVAAREHNCGTR